MINVGTKGTNVGTKNTKLTNIVRYKRYTTLWGVPFVPSFCTKARGMMMRTKYNAKKVTVDGIVFDSKLEAKRYQFLAGQQAQGFISGLELQVPFILVPKFKHEGKAIREMRYIADFRYTNSLGEIVIEDPKGYRTQDYKNKIKMFLWQYCRTGSVKFYEITDPEDTRGIP